MSATSSIHPGEVEEKRVDTFTYVVQRGDTLAGVALRLGVKQSELKRANHMYGSKTLITGQLLKVGTPVNQATAAVVTNNSSGTTNTASATDTDSAFVAGIGRREGEEEGQEEEKKERETVATREVTNVDAVQSKAVAVSVSAEDTGGVVEAAEAEGEEEEEEEPKGGPESTTGEHRGNVMDAREGEPLLSAVGADEGEYLNADGFLHNGPGCRSGGTDKPRLDELVTACSSRQPSDASTSAPAGAGAGASIRNAFRYMFSPSPSASKTSGGNFSESLSTANPAVTLEGLPCQEPWPAERDSRASSAARLGSRSAREASDSSTKSAAQTLLAMMTPRSWRGGSEWGTEVESRGQAALRNSFEGDDDDEGGPSRYFSSLKGDGGAMSMADAMASGGSGVGDEAGGGDILSTAAPSPATLKLPGLIAGGSNIVTHSTLARMELALSKHYRGYNWFLLFSTYRDGASYTTLYNNIKGEEPTYVVIESMTGEVFGGFATCAWASGCSYYGTGECFLFKIEGERTDREASSKTAGGGGATGGDDAGGKAKVMDGEITAYPWTGMNTYMQYSDCAGLGMGGGGEEAAFGLFIGDDFLSGSTGRCDTFSNPPLCSKGQFQISQVEVWGFTTADSEMGARLERLRKTLRGKTTRPL